MSDANITNNPDAILSLKASVLGFVAATTAMTLLMVVVGNLQ